jgi:hypothetical protein
MVGVRVGVEAVAGVAAAAPFWPIDAFEMSEAGRIDALTALQQLGSWVEAQSMRLMAAMGNEATDLGEHEFVADEIACALRMTNNAAAGRLDLADQLARRLPDTLRALEAGSITIRHVHVLIDGVRNLPDELASTVEQTVLPKAEQQTPAQLRAAVQRAVLTVDPRDAEQRHEQAAEKRRVCHRPVENGMAEIWALLPADGAAALMTRLDAEAARLKSADAACGATRTADQRRADALVALAAQGLVDPTLPRWQGRRASVQVTVSAGTLLGRDDQPGELEGYGPIPAAMARALADDPTASWRLLHTDSQGQLLDYGTTTYRPPQPLVDFVVARDRRCRFPGCRRPARRCDIDHLIPFGRRGGITAASNCEALCGHHHRLKHESGWTVSGNPADELVWTSPTNHSYRAPPGTYPV